MRTRVTAYARSQGVLSTHGHTHSRLKPGMRPRHQHETASRSSRDILLPQAKPPPSPVPGFGLLAAPTSRPLKADRHSWARTNEDQRARRRRPSPRRSARRRCSRRPSNRDVARPARRSLVRYSTPRRWEGQGGTKRMSTKADDHPLLWMSTTSGCPPPQRG